ncbi:hypothetical protein BBP40_001447 [Aspergillus hancockii]|nr:hypothetical protein BBP40_001447 [Aspergillus hancockii]
MRLRTYTLKHYKTKLKSRKSLSPIYWNYTSPGSSHDSRSSTKRFSAPVKKQMGDRVEVRSDPNDPNTAGRIFLETAEALLYLDLKHPNITTLQSVAILGTVYVAFGYDAASWLCQGMTSRLVQDMGLHLDSNMLHKTSHITVAEAELRRQIYWSLYCVDKLSAGYTGRVCTMPEWWASRPYQVSDHPEKSDTSTSVDRTLFVHFQNSLTTLCQISEKIHLNL